MRMYCLKGKIMGEQILDYYKKKLKKEYKIAFISTFVICLLIHLYKLTNTLPNHDSVFNYYSDQNVLGSGRWALSLACGISSYYDLPWLNGLLSCVYIALTVVVVVALFKIDNSVLIIITGGLFAAAPATTETFFFMFTADGYMLAMLFSALAVYFSRIEEKRQICRVLSGILICISCAIYQAYVSFALILAVCYFIDILFQNIHSKKDCFKWIAGQILIYTISLVSYFVIWKFLLYISGTTANNYQGISDIGVISLEMLVGGLIRSLKSVLIYFIQWNVFEHGITLYSVINVVFIIFAAIGVIVAFIKSKIYKIAWALVLLFLCLAAIIPFSCIWHFVSSLLEYRAMMLQCITLFFILAAVLYERWAITCAKNAICILLLITVFNNAVMANIGYYYMNLSYERTYSEGVQMMARINDLQDEYDVGKIAVIGNKAELVQWQTIDTDTRDVAPAGKTIILTALLETSLMYDGIHTILFLQNTFGLELESADETKLEELSHSDIVKAMSCWPSNDSLAVIDDIIVVKLADVQ